MTNQRSIQGVVNALTVAYQYQINCELTADQCKTLLDYVERLKKAIEESKDYREKWLNSFTM